MSMNVRLMCEGCFQSSKCFKEDDNTRVLANPSYVDDICFSICKFPTSCWCNAKSSECLECISINEAYLLHGHDVIKQNIDYWSQWVGFICNISLHCINMLPFSDYIRYGTRYEPAGNTHVQLLPRVIETLRQDEHHSKSLRKEVVNASLPNNLKHLSPSLVLPRTPFVHKSWLMHVCPSTRN